MSKHLKQEDFEKSEIIQQVYNPTLVKGRGKEKLIGELDKAGKNVKTANGWVPVKGNQHLVKQQGVQHKVEEKKEEQVIHEKPVIKNEVVEEKIQAYNGGTIPVDVLMYLANKYSMEQPTETFISVMGSNVMVYGKEGNNYAIRIGDSRGVVLATPEDLEEIKPAAIENKVEEEKHEGKTEAEHVENLMQSNVTATSNKPGYDELSELDKIRYQGYLNYDAKYNKDKPYWSHEEIMKSLLSPKSKGPHPIASLGSVNLTTGSSKYFNIYKTWGEDSTYEVYKTNDGNYRIVATSGETPIHDPGNKVSFKADQTGRPLFEGTMIDWARGSKLKELASKYGNSIIGYTYK